MAPLGPPKQLFRNLFRKVVLRTAIAHFGWNILKDYNALTTPKRNGGGAWRDLALLADHALHQSLLLLKSSVQRAGSGMYTVIT
jgi:hypothetical protein